MSQLLAAQHTNEAARRLISRLTWFAAQLHAHVMRRAFGHAVRHCDRTVAQERFEPGERLCRG